MARLDDLLPEFKSESVLVKPKEDNISSGTKRRAWLIDDVNNRSSNIEKGFIEHIYKPDLYQSSHKVDNNSLKGSIDSIYKPKLLKFEDLRSNPLQLFRYLHYLAKNNNDNYKTPRVKLRDMMLYINISKDSARTALRFLLKQKFIERIEFQAGVLGWSKYQLRETICNELESAIKKGVIEPFILSESKVEKKENLVASEYIDLWDSIDFSSLENIGFTKKHLLQIKSKTTPEIVQESINHFSYSLKFNKKTQGYPSPIATLISVLKRGEVWIEPNYQSPQELAQLKILELKKAEIERKKRVEEELYQMAFDEWQQDLTLEQTEVIAPDLRKRGDITPPNAKLKIYFKEKIWPEKRINYLNLKR